MVPLPSGERRSAADGCQRAGRVVSPAKEGKEGTVSGRPGEAAGVSPRAGMGGLIGNGGDLPLKTQVAFELGFDSRSAALVGPQEPIEQARRRNHAGINPFDPVVGPAMIGKQPFAGRESARGGRRGLRRLSTR